MCPPSPVTHTQTHTPGAFTLMFKEFDEFFRWDGMAAEWYFREPRLGRWGRVGWMDGWTDDTVSTHPGERKSLSEHNRKETEQKQAHVFLDIKSLPVGLWAASPTILSFHPFGKQQNRSNPCAQKCACSHLLWQTVLAGLHVLCGITLMSEITKGWGVETQSKHIYFESFNNTKHLCFQTRICCLAWTAYTYIYIYM